MNLSDIVTAAKSEASVNAREASLDAATRGDLDAFVDFLVGEDKTTATARSYRSYVVTALTNDRAWAEQTSDVRSACRAFARYHEARQ